MLDLEPIKKRLALISKAQRDAEGGLDSATLDVEALLEEVKRLREAIHSHRRQSYKTYKVAQAWWDEDLWAVLDANHYYPNYEQGGDALRRRIGHPDAGGHDA